MNDIKKKKLCKEAEVLLEKIENTIVYIVESIKAKEIKEAA